MKDLIDALKTLLNTQFSTTFKRYIIGYADTVEVPEKSLPMLVISPISTTVQNSGTVKDMDTYNVQVKIIDDAKHYFDNNAGAWSQSDLLVQHMEWAEDRTNGKIDADTIVGVIRDNITGNSQYLFNDDVEIEYPTDPVDGTRFETIITFTAQDRNIR